MGSIKIGPWSPTWFVPKKLMLWLAGRHGIGHFVETGTYRGDTAFWASQYFDRVITCEQDKDIWREAHHRFGTNPVVVHENDSSVNMLRRLGCWTTTDARVMFWLDAHWQTGSTDEEATCPILEELSIIKERTGENFIFIDDVRLFQYPYWPKGREERWPGLRELMAALDGYEIGVYGDAFVCLPARHVLDFHVWQQEIKGTEDDIL